MSTPIYLLPHYFISSYRSLPIVLIVSLLSLIFFFFSSRRRHTRWTGDWSSDVCSSDLILDLSKIESGTVTVEAEEIFVSNLLDTVGRPFRHEADNRKLNFDIEVDPGRSEERRVGKECRARWASEHVKKKAVGRHVSICV